MTDVISYSGQLLKTLFENTSSFLVHRSSSYSALEVDALHQVDVKEQINGMRLVFFCLLPDCLLRNYAMLRILLLLLIFAKSMLW